MASDDSDKTVFKQPSPGGDSTVLKPTPGRRSGGGNPLERTARYANTPGARPFVDTNSAYFKTASGLNPLANSAATLLAVFEKTRRSVSHDDVGGLHQRLTGEIKTFETRARDLGIKQEIILAARYVLCTALDEAVLNTPWGSESAWAQRTLLTVFHNETSGGEKFFLILDRMRQAPAENINMLELIYILLSMGFEGRYRLQQRGRDALEQIKDDLFTSIRRHRGEFERSLAPKWQGLGNVKKTLTEFIPTWVIASIAAAILFFGYSGFRYWLYASATPVTEQLQEISEQSTEVR